MEGGLLMPMTTTLNHIKSVHFKISTIIIPAGVNINNFSLETDRYQVAAVSKEETL